MPVNYRRRALVALFTVLLVLIGAPSSAQEASPPASPAATPEGPTPTPGAPVTEDPNACPDGRLRIRDLASADQHLADGIQLADENLAARPVPLSLGCEF